jgi:MinD-like ATPase involved in chromosome partitioning or flagellar assembly
MTTICWSVKGGSGTTTVAAALALLNAKDRARPLLIDFAGDAAAVLGLNSEPAVGLADWFESSAGSSGLDSLTHLGGSSGREVEVLGTNRRVDCRDEHRWTMLADWIEQQSHQRPVVIDAATLNPSIYANVLKPEQSLLVLRPCFLAVRRAIQSQYANGLVLVREEGRTLSNNDIESATGLPIAAEITCDPLVARAVDAGLLNGRVPRSLTRPLRKLLFEARTDRQAVA